MKIAILQHMDFRIEVKSEHRTLNLVRVGTSGAFQPDIEVGSFVASSEGLGIDGVLQFYDHGNWSDEQLVDSFIQQVEWNSRLPRPYCTPASPELLNRIGAGLKHGITVSAPGFFGPQGRQVRAKVMFPDVTNNMEKFNFQGRRITNMEMECSAIYGLSNVLGHNALTICLIIANRVTHDFLDSYHDKILELGKLVLDRF